MTFFFLYPCLLFHWIFLSWLIIYTDFSFFFNNPSAPLFWFSILHRNYILLSFVFLRLFFPTISTRSLFWFMSFFIRHTRSHSICLFFSMNRYYLPSPLYFKQSTSHGNNIFHLVGPIFLCLPDRHQLVRMLFIHNGLHRF